MSGDKNMKTTVQEGSTVEHSRLRQVYQGVDATEATNISKRILILKITNKKNIKIFLQWKQLLNTVHTLTHLSYIHTHTHTHICAPYEPYIS